MIIIVAAGAFVLAAGVLYQVIGSRLDEHRYPAPGVMIEVEGQRLHVRCEGDGQPVVLFESGIAASSLSWVRVLREVAAFTRACTYDRAGLGWSAPPRHRRTVPRMRHELRAVLAHAAPAGPAVLVGHSFGAFLVCACAAEYPGDVAGLILIDPPSEWHGLTPRQKRLLWGGTRLSRIGAVLAQLGVVRACLALLTGGAPGVPRTFVRVFGPTAARTLEHLVGEVRKLPPEVHPVVRTIWCQPKCFRAMADHVEVFESLASAVRRLTSLPDVPLVIISSGDQPDDVIQRHRGLANLSPGGRHVVAAGSGHWIQFDDPDLVVATIRGMIERIRQARATSDGGAGHQFVR